MKKDYNVLGLIGLAMWSMAVILRETAIINYDIARLILGVMPNFGVVWGLVFFTMLFSVKGLKRDFDSKSIYLTLLIIMILLLLSEIIHAKFLNSPFDIWDMISSAIASIIIIIVNVLRGAKRAQETI